PRQHHGIRQHAPLYRRATALGTCGAGALSAVRLPRHEPGGVERLPGDPPRWDAAECARHHADARGAVRIPGLSQLRGQARPTVRQGKAAMSAPAPTSIVPKPKKTVALSGVPAGNTALCTVGRQGNDLHYRGYDILDFAERAQFEEVA